MRVTAKVAQARRDRFKKRCDHAMGMTAGVTFSRCKVSRSRYLSYVLTAQLLG